MAQKLCSHIWASLLLPSLDNGLREQKQNSKLSGRTQDGMISIGSTIFVAEKRLDGEGDAVKTE